MATFLLLIIYLAFISLGLPDSLFGTAWPAVYREFDIPLSWANYVLLLITLGTLISSLVSAKLINRFGTHVVASVSTLFTALAMLGFAMTNSFLPICLLAVPLGFGGGAIDAGLNNYVAVHYKAIHMNFLHCFYGVGVSISPYLMSLVISGNSGWRGGYRMVSLIQLGIAAVLFLSIPLWKRVHPEDSIPAEEKQKNIPLKETVKIPVLPFLWLMFFGSCALETVCGSWGSTFLVDHLGMTLDGAARTVFFYYLGIAVGRCVSGLLSMKLSSWKLIRLGVSLSLAAIVLLLFVRTPLLAGAALFLVSLGNSMVYPNLMHITPIIFGKDVSQSIMGTNMSAATLGVMLAPIFFGWIAENFGVHLYPPYLALCFIFMAAGTFLAAKKLKKMKRADI